MIKVLIVDDHSLVRLGLKKLLEDTADIDVVAEADCGEEAIRIAKEKQPDVVLMDVQMPGIGGMEATRRLVYQFPSMKILAVTRCDEDPVPSRILQDGAAGYLTKGAGVEELVLAIKTVQSGTRYISPEIAQKLAMQHISDSDQSPFEMLSERELQVAMMVVNCQKVADISERLHLSSKTVNSYRYRIFEKLKIDSDVELTHLALRYGLVDKDLVESN